MKLPWLREKTFLPRTLQKSSKILQDLESFTSSCNLSSEHFLEKNISQDPLKRCIFNQGVFAKTIIFPFFPIFGQNYHLPVFSNFFWKKIIFPFSYNFMAKTIIFPFFSNSFEKFFFLFFNFGQKLSFPSFFQNFLAKTILPFFFQFFGKNHHFPFFCNCFSIDNSSCLGPWE